MNASPTPEIPFSPRWGAPTKFLVALVGVVLLGALLVRFQMLLAPLFMAFILAYLLNPVVQWLEVRTGLAWGAAVNLTYLAVFLLLAVALTAAGIGIVQQVGSLYRAINETLPNLPARLQAVFSHPVQLGSLVIDLSRPLVIGPFTLDLAALNLQDVYNQLLSAVQPALSSTGVFVGSLASGTLEFVGWLFFVLVVSYYLLHSLPDVLPALEQMVPAGYAYDVRRMAAELGPLWNAFLRGQVTLAIVMGLVVASTQAVIGLRYAVALGALAGLMEFIPIVGPVTAATVAALVALFQPSNWLGLNPLYFALLVILVQTVLQQFENNVLVPRIIGGSLNLHPIAILVGAIIGASLFGIVGLLLSAPAQATLRVFGRYAYRKLFDLNPWPETPPRPPRAPRASWLTIVLRFIVGLRARFRRPRA